MKRKFKGRTAAFLIFMIVFFAVAGYLTYYSKVVYLRNLPQVAMQQPEASGEYVNGRMTYYIPQAALHKDETSGAYFIMTARHTRDVLGERYLAVRVDVRVMERTEDQMALVDGIVWAEPVLVETEKTIQNGDAIKYTE